jgi:hypothetical protein
MDINTDTTFSVLVIKLIPYCMKYGVVVPLNSIDTFMKQIKIIEHI